ncbi:hypothetical protein [Herbaspirillum sp. LeCh32-8]|uniref:hypothetical protein n=1 Tax=Herbaspirillum sp. LeCh32-8 TaxID=2821356 RepID=UPI001AE6F348|nr:hypothetical protein [Herbaspirillum sp. LeCh32-8]
MLRRESFSAFGYHVCSFSAESKNFASRFPLNLSFASKPLAIHPLKKSRSRLPAHSVHPLRFFAAAGAGTVFPLC